MSGSRLPEHASARWQTWDGEHEEVLVVRHEHGGWTAESLLERERAHAVIRLGADGTAQQLLLFRDLPEPDLWLAHDGAGRWGEVNGTRRPELDGCRHAAIAGSAGTTALTLLTLDVAVGSGVVADVMEVDVDTLEARAGRHRIRRISERSWSWERLDGSVAVDTLAVDADGVVLDQPHRFRRTG